MTEVTLLQRLARERLYDLMPSRDGVWRGTCPCCGRLPPVSSVSFEVYETFFHCRDCGIHGDVVCLLRCNDGLSELEARAEIARREAALP